MATVFAPSAPELADLVAASEVALAAMLVAGMFLVRARHVRLHKYVQSAVVLVNLPIVLAAMLPQYLAHVLPDLPGDLGRPYYLLPTLAVFVGGAAEALGIFILLVAGTNWVPERWRFRRYKRWMRTELVLWWTVVILGLAIYYVWYVGVAAPSSGGSW